MPMAVTCSVTDNHNARPKNAYEQHRALVDELEKTKEKLISIERKLQGLEFEHSQDSDQLPPPYTDIVFESTEGRKVYAHKAVLVSLSYQFGHSFFFLFEKCFHVLLNELCQRCLPTSCAIPAAGWLVK